MACGETFCGVSGKTFLRREIGAGECGEFRAAFFVRKSVCQLKGCETGGASAFELALAGV
jgi:hypothetical protein